MTLNSKDRAMEHPHIITTAADLAALFDPVSEAALRKQVSYLHPTYQAMIAASPFVILSTVGVAGLDASPRGDAPGFVVVRDERTLLLPERRGNNRIDSLHNIVGDPRVGLLFLIPGVGETLRVNGRARISVAPSLLEQFAVRGAPPKCVLEISVEEVFFQCAMAIQRSKLWSKLPDDVVRAVPSAGQVLAALTNHELGGEQYDRDLPDRQRSRL
jgi:PPOX class probable FMN-dependent enzyme